MSSPEIPLQIITPDDVRESIRRAKWSLERAAEEIVWQIEREAWRTLGYSSWDAMREAEYGGAAIMLPTGSRPRVAAQLKAIQVGTTSRGGPKHLTDKEIASTLGVSKRQVEDDLNNNNKRRSSATFVDPDSDDDVIDAEVIEDNSSESDEFTWSFACGESHCLHEPVCARVAPTARNHTPPEPKTARRRPLPDSYRDMSWRVLKSVESVSRLHQDDRFKGNREAVKRHGPELARAANELLDLLDDLDIDRHQYGGAG